jgi:short-subunit dehydrogenase
MHNETRNGTGKTALITGATRGIGFELARVFAKEGFDLILVARDARELERSALDLRVEGVRVTPIAKNLSQADAAEELYAETRAQGLQVDVLVNDAGQGEFGPFLEADLGRHLEIIQINVASLTALTHLYGRDMVARGSGRILQLASIVSKMPSPLLAVYGATKAYVYSLSHALANELKDTGVTVTALLPGATDTGFFEQAGDEEWEAHREGLADPAKVARDGYEALMAGKTHVISGAMNKAYGAMSAVLPDEALAERMRKENEPRVN